MDRQTLEYYDRNAVDVAARYRSVDQRSWQQLCRDVFPAGARIVDVGCGSGRDVAAMLEMGFDACGFEPAEGMRKECLEKFPQLVGRILPVGLPLPERMDSIGQFDGVVCSAVFMHVPEPERFDAAYSLKRLLREKGKLWGGPRRVGSTV